MLFPCKLLNQQNQNASCECLESIKNVDRNKVGSIQASYLASQAAPDREQGSRR